MAVVNYEIKDHIAHVVMNDPGTRNSMTKAMQNGLIAALSDAEASPEVCVVLLSAAGDSFCAGGDLRLFQTLRERSGTEIYSEARRSADLFKLLAEFKKPIVAAVNGPALGGGFGVVCNASIVIASDRAKFGCTEIKLGLFPLVILPAVRRLIGDRKTLELSLLGDVLDAAAAEKIGVVNKVVAHDQLSDEAAKVAKRIASFSPLAIRLGMEGFRSTAEIPPDKAIEALLALRVVFSHSEDLHEGATAFLERRAPVWVGR